MLSLPEKEEEEKARNSQTEAVRFLKVFRGEEEIRFYFCKLIDFLQTQFRRWAHTADCVGFVTSFGANNIQNKDNKE